MTPLKELRRVIAARPDGRLAERSASGRSLDGGTYANGLLDQQIRRNRGLRPIDWPD